MKNTQKLLTMIVILIIFTTILSSCGDKFTAFEIIPDSDLNNEYYLKLNEHFMDFSHIYIYLMVEYQSDHVNNVDEKDYFYDPNAPEMVEYKKLYDDLKISDPETAKVITNSFNKFHAITKKMTYDNRVFEFESMQKAINTYVLNVYLNEEGELPLEKVASAEFLALDPKKNVQDYLTENKIHITKIEFTDVFSKFYHHIYPYRIDYKFNIFYYIGDVELPEKNWKTTALNLQYFVGIDAKNDYVLEYINNPAIVKEIIEQEKATEKPQKETETVSDK